MKFQFKKVKGERLYKKWKEWEVGDYVLGRLTEVGEDQFKKANYIVEVMETSFDDVPVGKNMCLNSNGSLDYRMQDVEIGTIIRVEYEGEDVMEKGPFKGKPFHMVGLEVAVGEDTSVEEDEDLGL